MSAVRETMSARENLVRSERRIEDWGKTGEYLVVHNQKDSMKYAMVVKKKTVRYLKIGAKERARGLI